MVKVGKYTSSMDAMGLYPLYTWRKFNQPNAGGAPEIQPNTPEDLVMYIYIYINIRLNVYIYMYIYIERDKERYAKYIYICKYMITYMYICKYLQSYFSID